jgi:hypothetical protein
MSALPEEAAAPLTWENHDFTMGCSVAGSQIALKSAPASNKFKLKPFPDQNGNVYLYKLKPIPHLDDVNDPWIGCKLLPLTGAELLWPGNFQKLDPTDPVALSVWGKKLYDDVISKNPQGAFERLIGLVPTRESEDGYTFNPVSFYRVRRALIDQSKLLLLAYVNLIGAAPVGTVAAND